MRLHVLSDLHLQRFAWTPPRLDVDAVVLAGDIAAGTRGVEWARTWARDLPVLYVAGNHEFYGHTMPGLIDELRRAAAGSSVRVLENDEVILDGVRFLGCTLWSEFRLRRVGAARAGNAPLPESGQRLPAHHVRAPRPNTRAARYAGIPPLQPTLACGTPRAAA